MNDARPTEKFELSMYKARKMTKDEQPEVTGSASSSSAQPVEVPMGMAELTEDQDL